LRPPPRPTLFPYTTLFRSVIHHMPGYDRESKETTRTFATKGYVAVCPNLFHRYAPGAKWSDAAAAARAAGGVPDEQCVGDVAGRSEEHTSELQSLAYLVCR